MCRISGVAGTNNCLSCNMVFQTIDCDLLLVSMTRGREDSGVAEYMVRRTRSWPTRLGSAGMMRLILQTE